MPLNQNDKNEIKQIVESTVNQAISDWIERVVVTAIVSVWIVGAIVMFIGLIASIR